MIEHQFTPTILKILSDDFGKDAPAIFAASPLLGYLNHKTRSASRGSRSRASFGNLYAIYVLIEDYIKGDFHTSGTYKDYAGASFSRYSSDRKNFLLGQNYKTTI